MMIEVKFNDYNFKNTLQLKSIVCRWNKRHLFVYSSWLYLLFYYTFHYEDMYCDYIKLVIFKFISH